MMLLTSCPVNLKSKESIWRIVEIYLTRWKCDESFLYIKQCYTLEDTMRIISFIEDGQVIRAILEHLGVWLVRSRPPPKIHDLSVYGTGRSAAPSIVDDVSQNPIHDDHFYGDPQYAWDDYVQA